MKLSIIIAFHEYGHYLKQCLASIKEQSFKDLETVLVMDHVDENIDDIISEYSEAVNLKVVYSPSRGVAASRNEGLKEASGEYVYFLDSDDFVLDETFCELFKEERIEDIVYGLVKNTWNNKANYLEKLAKKLEESKVNEDNNEFEFDVFVHVYKSLIKKRKGLNQLSVLGMAYRRELLVKHNIMFNEEFKYYSDIPFLFETLDKAESYYFAQNSHYIKRKHNDPINYPSLNQYNDENRFIERMNMYKYTRTVIGNNSELRYLFDKKIISYYLNTFVKRLRRSEDPIWRKEYYPIFSKILKDCNEECVKSYKREKRNLIRSIQSNNLKKTLSLVRIYLGKKKLKSILKNKNVNGIYKLAYYHIFLKLPVKQNVVIFETFNAKNYSDSPKYIYEYLAKTYGKDFKYVWALNTKTKLPYEGKKVKRFSFQYAYYLARSKYLVFNVRPPLWYRKREGQVFLETWHGTPLKRLVFDQEEVTAASPTYKMEFYKQRKDWDYLISANDFSTETLSRCFMYEGEMLASGYPRNDIMYAKNKEEIAKHIKTSLGIPHDKKVILYAPTWRDDEFYGKGKYKFTLKLDLPLLKEQLGKEYVILLRTHQYIADVLDVTGLEGFAYNVSKYDDISELYLISDICITDYSSVFFDYANLRRPMLFYTYDIEKYANQLRGFYIDMSSELPGPLLYTSEEVIDAIKNIDQITLQYKDKYDEFYNRFCHLDDGQASKRVVDRVFFNK